MARDAMATVGAPAVDQYIANVRDCERRTDTEDSAVVPWWYIDTDEVLSRLVTDFAQTPTLVWRDLRRDAPPAPDPVTDSRPAVRLLSQPRVAYVLDPTNPYDQIGTARNVVRGLTPSQCDRCAWAGDWFNILLAEAGTGFVAIVLDRECVDELGVRDWVIS